MRISRLTQAVRAGIHQRHAPKFDWQANSLFWRWYMASKPWHNWRALVASGTKGG